MLSLSEYEPPYSQSWDGPCNCTYTNGAVERRTQGSPAPLITQYDASCRSSSAKTIGATSVACSTATGTYSRQPAEEPAEALVVALQGSGGNS